GEYGYSRGKKRATQEDSPASASADDDRGKRRRSTKEAIVENKRSQNNRSALVSTNNPRRKRPIPNEPSSSSRERPRTSGTSAQGSNATSSAACSSRVEDAADAGRGSGKDQTKRGLSAAAARVEPSESAPMMDGFVLDPDANNRNVSGHAPVLSGGLDLSSTYYGYDESDRDVHDKALDLGLSDYLADGFTSTW
ncbi:hypothetical protein FRC09_017362, partial [Ceratobasidium sp. 395]